MGPEYEPLKEASELCEEDGLDDAEELVEKEALLEEDDHGLFIEFKEIDGLPERVIVQVGQPFIVDEADAFEELLIDLDDKGLFDSDADLLSLPDTLELAEFAGDIEKEADCELDGPLTRLILKATPLKTTELSVVKPKVKELV